MTDRPPVCVPNVPEVSPMANDFAVRQRLLGLFYTTRRKNMKQPGLGVTTMEEMMKMPAGSLEFHLWYICEKGWIQREVSGPWSITYAGVDEIETRESERTRSAQRVTACQ